MKHLESKDYQKVNESFRCRLVYHVGPERILDEGKSWRSVCDCH